MNENTLTNETIISEPLSAAQQVTVHQDSMSIIGLISEASFTVQMVMLLLLIASIISWGIIFTKYRALRKEKEQSATFEHAFWTEKDMQVLYHKWSDQRCSMSEIFVAGFSEYERAQACVSQNKAESIDSIHRAMRIQLGREMEKLESHIPFLATIGSTSPYVGLFGTVWGIMNSFRSLGLSTQQATVSSVAPGIAEALIATALGLLAAIPAVIAYNRFSLLTDKLIHRNEIFMEEFLSVAQRNLSAQKATDE